MSDKVSNGFQWVENGETGDPTGVRRNRDGTVFPVVTASADGRLRNAPEPDTKPYELLSLIGDSHSDNDVPVVASGRNGPGADGVGFISQMLTMGRLRLHTARATGGYTIQEIIATHLPQVIADSPGRVRVLAGTNNTYTATAPAAAATSFALLRDGLWRPLLDLGFPVDACTPPPLASRTETVTAAQHSEAKQFVDLIRASEGLHRNLQVVEQTTPLESASGANEGLDTSLFVSTETTYAHWNDSGGMLESLAYCRALEKRGVTARGPERMGHTSPYSLGANPRGAGNNASGTNKALLNTGVTGTGPDGWTFGRTGTSVAVVTPAAVARDDGQPGQLVQVAVTIGGAGETVNISPTTGGIQYISGSSTSVHLRNNSAAYIQGECRKFTNGLYYKVVQPGTSAGAEPGTLPTALGSYVTDGTVIWQKILELVPGLWVKAVAELYFTAHSVGNIFPMAQLKQYTAAFGNLAAGVRFEANNTIYTAGSAGSSWGTVQGPTVTGHNGYKVGVLPLNKWLRVETPWVELAADCGIIEPSLRIIGGAAAQCTAQVGYCGYQTRAA